MHNWELKMLKEGHEDLLRKNSTVSKEVSEVSSRPQTTLHSKKLVKPNKHPHDVK